jgi:hypothetical protein
MLTELRFGGVDFARFASAGFDPKGIKTEEIEWIDLRFTDPRGKWHHLQMCAGAMGEVFRGMDTGLNRRVAIKILSEKHRDSPELRARFVREGRAVAAISHPNVVQVFATGAFDGRTPEVVNRPVPPAVVEQPAPTKVRDQLAEAGAALESLTRETTDKAVGPTMILLDSAARATAPADPSPLADDPTLALASLPSAARSSLDPITTTTRRAMTRLLKDVGLRPH